MKDDYITCKQAMALLSVCRKTIERRVNEGRLTRYKMGTQAVRFKRNEVMALIKISS